MLNTMRGVLGRVVAQFRRHAGMTQAELADALGVAQGTVSKWESGALALTVEDLCRVGQALEVPAWVMLAEAESGGASFSALRMETLRTLLRAPREETLE